MIQNAVQAVKWRLTRRKRVRNAMAEVAPGLYVGSSLSAREFNGRFDRCVSVAEGLEYETTTDSFNLVPHDDVLDRHTEFRAAVDAVREMIQAEDTVLVHCHEGKERAPTVAATALAAEENMSFAEAMAQTREHRPLVDPTPPLRTLGRDYLDHGGDA